MDHTLLSHSVFTFTEKTFITVSFRIHIHWENIHYCHISYSHSRRKHTSLSHSVFTFTERTFVTVTFSIHIQRENIHYCHIPYSHSQREHTFLLHFLSNSYMGHTLLSHSVFRFTDRTFITVTFRIHIQRENIHYCHIHYSLSERKHTLLSHSVYTFTERTYIPVTVFIQFIYGTHIAVTFPTDIHKNDIYYFYRKRYFYALYLWQVLTQGTFRRRFNVRRSYTFIFVQAP